jgi:hypothetical protein
MITGAGSASGIVSSAHIGDYVPPARLLMCSLRNVTVDPTFVEESPKKCLTSQPQQWGQVKAHVKLGFWLDGHSSLIYPALMSLS